MTNAGGPADTDGVMDSVMEECRQSLSYTDSDAPKSGAGELELTHLIAYEPKYRLDC